MVIYYLKSKSTFLQYDDKIEKCRYAILILIVDLLFRFIIVLSNDNR